MKTLNTKNKWRVCLSSLALCAFMVLCEIPTYAKTSGDVPITYTKEADTTYILHVEISGLGQIETGSEELRNQKKDYELAVDEIISFNLKPDKGAEIESVELNGKNILLTNQKKVSVRGLAQEQILKIKFQSSVTDTPKTGDSTNIWTWIMLFLMSLSGSAYIWHKRRKRKNKQRK